MYLAVLPLLPRHAASEEGTVASELRPARAPFRESLSRRRDRWGALTGAFVTSIP